MEQFISPGRARRRFNPTAADPRALAGAERFDLIISDITLPDGSGLDLMGELRQTSTVKGIAMSGLTSPEDQQNSRDAGFAAHLAKPIDFMKLQDAINRMFTAG